jgi:CBS domain-containing protein
VDGAPEPRNAEGELMNAAASQSSPSTSSRAVRDVMKDNILTVAPDQSIRLATQMMLWSSIRHLPVVRDGRLVGMVSDRDLLRAGHLGSTIGNIEDVMSHPVETVGPDTSLKDAAAKLVEHSIDCLPVVTGDNLLGLITTTDLLDEMSHPRPKPAEPRVRDVMSTMTISVGPEDDLIDVIAMMVREGVRHLPIVDSDRRVVGIVSDRDVRTVIGDPLTALNHADERSQDPWPVESVMTANPITVPSDATIDDLAQRLVDESIGAVPVVDEDDRLLGMVSYVDLLHFAYRKGA